MKYTDSRICPYPFGAEILPAFGVSALSIYCIMTAKEFFDKVRLMREAQQRYSRTRSHNALVDSKRYENIIDAEIVRVEKLLKEQKPEEKTLF